MTNKTNIDDAVCRHCGKVIGTVPKHYCPRSPNQTHEPVEPPTETITPELTCEHCGKPLSVCEQEKADIWDHHHQEPDEAVTINLTPRGMETPEGVRRVNEAINTYEEALRGFASACALFLDEHNLALIEMVSSESPADPSIRDDWHQLNALLATFRRKHEAFLRVVAGAPPAQEGQ